MLISVVEVLLVLLGPTFKFNLFDVGSITRLKKKLSSKKRKPAKKRRNTALITENSHKMLYNNKTTKNTEE